MIYSINNFFEKHECKPIINFAEKTGIEFSYTNNSSWDCKRVYDLGFKNDIVERFKKQYDNDELRLWFPFEKFEIKDVNISLTKYYDGRWLDLHLDLTSQLTTVIVLSDNFIGGEFLLSKTYDKNDCQKHNLKIGQSISFNGSSIYHGVSPVTNGIRCALNIWMTDTDFKYLKINEPKKIL